MEDNQIIDLYFARSESAISETALKYGGYCHSIAYNILSSSEDAEESVSDTYLAVWNSVPPHRPGIFSAYLGKITRHLSIDRWRSRRAARRGGGEVALAIEELDESLAGTRDVESDYARKELLRGLNRALEDLPQVERSVFLCRYWYLDSCADIAGHFGFTEAKVRTMLHRTRGKLRTRLEKEELL